MTDVSHLEEVTTVSSCFTVILPYPFIYLLNKYNVCFFSDCDVLDVVFLLDSSEDISEREFESQVISTARSLVQKWHGRIGYNLIHIAVVVYGNRPDVSVKMNKFESCRELQFNFRSLANYISYNHFRWR